MCRRGFTLLEILLSLAALALIAGLSMPLYNGLELSNELDSSAQLVSGSLHRAQTLAQGMEGDSAWGLYWNLGDLVIFKGASYIGHDTAFDENIALPGSVSISPANSVIFAKFTGEVAATSLTLTSSNGQTKSLSINTKGTVEY